MQSLKYGTVLLEFTTFEVKDMLKYAREIKNQKS